MLEVENARVYYGQFLALEDVSLTLPDRGITALIGANAAGKTTTLRVISGVLPLRSGRVRSDGSDLAGCSPEERVRRGIVHVPEGRKLFGTLTVEENLLVGGYQRRKSTSYRKTLDRVYDLFPRLAERRDQPAGSLSGGEQQMCAVGRGLMAQPRLLLIDEMSLGLAPVVVKSMFEFVRQVAAEDVSVLIVEQQVQHALLVADHATIIDKGVTTRSGTASDLRDDPVVKEAYLGV
ncbi:MAG: ATP-binding cassette domain-containing protein [Streptosporangiales bacterium]|nr:ATP-binding cassette domain-containing protein [Streptosporangiales bacterium]